MGEIKSFSTFQEKRSTKDIKIDTDDFSIRIIRLIIQECQSIKREIPYSKWVKILITEGKQMVVVQAGGENCT